MSIQTGAIIPALYSGDFPKFYKARWIVLTSEHLLTHCAFAYLSIGELAKVSSVSKSWNTAATDRINRREVADTLRISDLYADCPIPEKDLFVTKYLKNNGVRSLEQFVKRVAKTPLNQSISLQFVYHPTSYINIHSDRPDGPDLIFTDLLPPSDPIHLLPDLNLADIAQSDDIVRSIGHQYFREERSIQVPCFSIKSILKTQEPLDLPKIHNYIVNTLEAAFAEENLDPDLYASEFKGLGKELPDLCRKAMDIIQNPEKPLEERQEAIIQFYALNFLMTPISASELFREELITPGNEADPEGRKELMKLIDMAVGLRDHPIPWFSKFRQALDQAYDTRICRESSIASRLESLPSLFKSRGLV